MPDTADTIVPPIPYELRIGVTGHRELADVSAVAKAVASAIEHLANLLEAPGCPTPVNWVVVSSLAKGADRIVAKAVLGRPGAALELVPPFDLDEYRKDFVESADRAEFELILHDHKPRVSPPALTPPPTDKRQRDLGYLKAGELVVDASEIIIAVWNGKSGKGPGGTADAVAYAIGSNRKVIWIDPGAAAPQPKWLRAARHGEQHDFSLNDLHLKVEPLPDRRRLLSQGYCRQAAFNCKHKLPATTLREGIEERTEKLLTLAKSSGLNRQRLDPILRHVVPLYTKATLWAMRCKWWYTLSSVMTYLLAAFAVTVAVVQVHFFPQQTWIIGFEVAAMVLSLVAVLLARRRFWHDRWLYARYLAEQLRIAMYTLVLPDDPSDQLKQAPRSLPFYGGPDHWLATIVTRTVQLVVKEAGEAAADDKLHPAEFQTIKRFIIDGWLRDQRKHHATAAQRKHRSHRRGRLAIVSLFALTLLAAVLHALHIGSGYVGLAITATAIALPAWAAAVHGLSRHFESERLAARATQMEHALTRFVKQAELAETPADLRIVLHGAAHAMGLETYEWLIQLSFGPPEVVV